MPIYPWISNSLVNFLRDCNMSTITFPIKSYDEVTTTTIISNSTSTVTTFTWVEHPVAVDISGFIWFLLGVIVIAFPFILLVKLIRH